MVAFVSPESHGLDSRALWREIERDVELHGGQVKAIGEPLVIAVFGGTRALEDHASHAITVALRAARRPDAPDRHLQVGVASGEVPTNEALWASDLDGAPIGVAVALAHAAGAGSVLAAASAIALLRTDVRCGEAIDDVPLAPEHAPARRLLSIGQMRVRRPLTQFVGRARQLDLLHDALELARGGSGQIVGIMGEPGMGKSRLLSEFAGSIGRAGAQVLMGRCVPYGENRPYVPLIGLLRDLFALSADDPPEAARARVAGALRELDMPQETGLYVLHLLGLSTQTEDEPISSFAPEAVQARTFAALQSTLMTAAVRRLLVIAIEDTHWIDDTSRRFLEHLAAGIAASRMLMVTTYRPGGRAVGVEMSHGTQIALARLGPSDSLRVIQSILPSEEIAEDVARALIARAEGNPFFLEELSLAAGESDDPTGVPETVQGVIRARIDRLPEVPRRLLQTAAVLGRSFPLELLLDLWGGPGSPRDHLDRLTRDEFIVPAYVDGVQGYEFKHALTQLVAYETLPARRRSALHEAAGLCLETAFAGRVDQAYELLAYHWSRTEDDARAIGYLLRASESNFRRYAHREASAALEEALRHAELLPESERDARVVELTLRLLNSLYFLGRMRESRERLDAQCDRVEALADPALASGFYFWVAHTASHLGEPARARAAADRAAAEGALAGDAAAVGRALYILCRQGWWTGRFREGIARGQDAVPRLEGAGEYWWLGHCHFFIAHSLYSLGQFDAALEAARRGGAIGDAVADPRLRSWAAWAEGLYEAARGSTGRGIERCGRAVELSPDAPNTAWALGALGFARREEGDLEQAVRDLSEAIAIAASTNHPGILARFQGWLAVAHLRRGDLDSAERSARESHAIAEGCGCRWVMALAQRTLGQIALQAGDLPAARRSLTGARAALESLECAFDLALCDMSLAVLAHRSRRDPAPALDAAHTSLAGLPAPVYVERLRSLRADLGCPEHDPSGFSRLTRREREVLELLARGLTNRAIADRLVISEATAIRHVANIYAKIGVTNRASAARAAIERGLAGAEAPT